MKACWTEASRALLLECIEEKSMSLHACFALVLVLFLTGCFNTLEQRWEAIDTDLRAEIGVKTKDYYITEWGNLAKRVRSEDAGETLIWTFSGYGGAQGWRKTLMFTPEGVLKGFSRDYWPKRAMLKSLF
jgi:hypothetical protein